MQIDYKILPKRNGQTDGSFKSLNTTKFFTNFYEISIDNTKSKIYQYSFALPEEIPQDSQLYSKSIYSIKRSLKDKIGYLGHSGQMIWGTVGLKVPTTFNCKFQYEQSKYQFEAMVKLTKQLNLKELDQDKTRNVYIQILNIDLKNSLKSLKLAEVGKKGQFFEKQISGSQPLYEKGLQVLTGFRFTLSPLNSGLYLQVDVCSRVLQARNLLESLDSKSNDYNKRFQGETVITKYGTYRTYKIEQIDYNKSPISTFYHEKKGATMTYRDYYKEMYGIKIDNNKQPLLKATKSVRKQLIKGGKQYKEIKETVYLVPQLVSLTGMTDAQREDRFTMQELAPFTKLSPTQRIVQCEKIIEALNGVKSLLQIKNAKRLDGYCLPPPNLKYSGASIQPDRGGNIKHRGVLKEPFNFTDWVFIYSVGGRKNVDDNAEADDAVGLLIQAAKTYGVKFKEPGFITVKSLDVEDWKYQLANDAKKNGTPQIVVVFVAGPREQGMYGQLKRYLTNEMKCPSQFIKRRTLTNPKGAMSAASKIIIQMNVKVGAVPWQVQKSHPYFKGKNMMYGALSISKGKKGNTLAFVGTIDSQCTRVFSECKVGIKDKENIPVNMLEEMFIGWAKSYYLANKKTPDLILLYREGLSIPQIKSQLPKMDIPALESMIKKIGEKTGTKNYNPQFMIITVNKKINNRYFAMGQEGRQDRNKFIPKLFNPDSGSIIVEAMSSPDMYQFHLAAQYVTQGTCTPTLFRVAYDTTKLPLPQEALITFTYEQCFNYYNWEGAVRVPACLQCADKLSKLVGQYIREDISQSAVTKKHFFL